MANFLEDNEDLKFYVNEYIDWGGLADHLEQYGVGDAPSNREEAVSVYRDIFSLIGEFSANEIAPRAVAMDKAGTRLVDGEVETSPEHQEIFKQFNEMGLPGLCAPRSLDGMNAPGTAYLVLCELIGRGDVSTLVHLGFHVGTIISLVQFASLEGSVELGKDGEILKTPFDDVIREIATGKAWGAMDLTESEAGSDLAALRMKATKDKTDQSKWRLNGGKIFITSGHAQWHLVLAKTGDGDRLEDLSLFLVPRVLDREGAKETNILIERVEEKIGHHASPTCALRFENAEGRLIGGVGEGFRYMLSLMNHARLGVAFESIGVCQAAFYAARDYAAERTSMGKTIDQHPMIASYLEDMDITVRGIRAIGLQAAVAEDELIALKRKEAASEVKDSARSRRIKALKHKVRHLTPLLKYTAAEEAVRLSRVAMQIHGGNGYTQDYAPERLLRDALVLPVYEGTSQIQALMTLKDNLGAITKDPQRFLRRLGNAKIQSVRSTDPLERSFYRVQYLAYAAQQNILWRVAKDKWSDAISGPVSRVFDRFLKDWDPKRDFDHGLLHAENLCRILSDVAIARALLKQTEAHPERRKIAERWLERAEPRVRYHYDLIHSTGESILAGLSQEEPQQAVG